MIDFAQRMVGALLVGAVLWFAIGQFDWSKSTATSSAPTVVAPNNPAVAPKSNVQLREEAAHKAKLEALAREEELLRKHEALRQSQQRAAENRELEKARLSAIELERRKARLEARQREDDARREQQAREERRLDDVRERCARARAAWPGHPQDIQGITYPCDYWGRYCGSQQTVDEQGRRICR